jgi:signal transduction histidine kinase
MPMHSLRNKILRTYGYSKLVLLAFATVVAVDLYVLDRQIQQGQAVTDFREAVLEMRRDEKNLFLYGDLSSLDELLLQEAAARSALAVGRDAFVAINGEATFRRMQLLLAGYAAEIDSYPFLDHSGQASARAVIREIGHDLTEASQDLLRGERHMLAEATRRAQITLLLAFIGVVILGLAGGFFLVRRVVRPLRALEQGLLAIDEGRARELSLPSKDQEIRSFVAAFNRMLKRMRQQQDQVRRNEKAAALGVLVSGVAHELNNPLSNISTSAQLLLEEGETVDAETRRLWLAQIDSETERSRRIVRRLLDSVRSPKAHAQRQSLLDVIESSVALVKRQIPPAVDLRVGTRDDIDVAVDRERLQQVFINLIKNAADAGARHIMVNVWPAAWDEAIAEAGHLEGDPAAVRQAGRAARVTVEDDGPGIAPELRENVFAPFFTTRSTGDGTGLGLYLVNEIVGEHRGCIVVDSPATGGTRFSIWLPLNEENVA